MDNFELYYRLNKNNRSKKITGVPPLSFVSNGENLSDCKIYGNTVSEKSVGELVTEGEHSGQYCIPIVVAGKNLFDKTNLNSILNCYISASKLATSADTRSVFIECKPATAYTVSKRRGTRFIVGWTDVLPKSGVEIQDRVIDYTAASITTTTGLGAKYLVAYIYNRAQDTLITAEEMIESVQIEEGSSATDYEPHYESQTAAIYLNEPLAEGESISSRSAGVSIPTINGTTILSVDTIVQPSHIYIKYGDGGSDNSSLLKYLKYKYKYAKE